MVGTVGLEPTQTYLDAGGLQPLELKPVLSMPILFVGIAWGTRTPVVRRHLERVMTVTGRQHAM